MSKLKPLDISRSGYKPVTDRTPDQQTISERARFLAFEIHNDVLASEGEIAEAIEREIRRFAKKSR